jgi:FixJ family two-component response regulator
VTTAAEATATTADQRTESLARLTAIAAQLGPDELTVLEMVAAGLAHGRAVYGELDLAHDRRDFRAEAGDELRDALVYLAAELLRLRLRRPR